MWFKYEGALKAAGDAMNDVLHILSTPEFETMEGWKKKKENKSDVVYSRRFEFGKVFTLRVSCYRCLIWLYEHFINKQKTKNKKTKIRGLNLLGSKKFHKHFQWTSFDSKKKHSACPRTKSKMFATYFRFKNVCNLLPFLSNFCEIFARWRFFFFFFEVFSIAILFPTRFPLMK